MTPRQELARRLRVGGLPVFAPLCLDALTARIAGAAGFMAGYVSGGALGYAHAVSEALLTLDELVDCVRHVCARSTLPLIVDGGVGFGDAVHVTRTIQAVEATGAAGIEIEDQVAPKRVSHHRGVEHLVAPDEMCAKIRFAVAARNDSDFLIIARTGGFRNESFASAIARAFAYRDAGADLVMVLAADDEQWRRAAHALAMPLATIAALDARSPEAWQSLGVRLVIDPFTAQVLAVDAIAGAYRRFCTEGRTGCDLRALMRSYRELPDLAGLEAYYEIERQTTESGSDDVR